MTNSRRTKLAMKVALVCLSCLMIGLLVAWAAFIPRYNAWRAPDNIFDELYWSCIDEGCNRAVLCEAGLFWPGEYLPAFFNPFRYTGLSSMGAEPYKWPDSRSLYFEANGDRSLHSPLVRYCSIYGFYEYDMSSLKNSLNGLSYKIDYLYLEASEKRTDGTSDKISILIGIDTGEPNTKSYDHDINASITANIEDDEVSRKVISWNQDLGQEESEQIVEAAFFDCFLNDYFDAYPESKFDKNDLGQWKWGEIEYEGV